MNMHFAASPGRRQRLNSGVLRGSGTRDWSSLLEPLTSELHPGWEEAALDELDRARRQGATVLTLEDESYPRLLRVASDPPWVLYVWGELRPEDVLAIAVVGSRRATRHGLEVASGIGRGLAASGFTIVSGLARGIDAAGHKGALEGGGRTIAVLGSGLDRVYPVEHRRLAELIAGSGAVVTEFPCGTAPLKRHFPERNRLIATLSWATVVVEAARDSGSLITADLAADEGRTVYAVPGPVDEPNAEGTNGLLRSGALVCRCAADVVEDLAPQIVDAARSLAGTRVAGPRDTGVASSAAPLLSGPGAVPCDVQALTPEERRVLSRVPKTRGIGIERLGVACGLPPGTLLAVLLELELRGLVRQLPGRRFTSAACKF
ncbi:MAG: DNA-protecting protein DprA [Acidobacteria bacterium]|nr:MAG: DNA-protecting protein DprA [Acidobacteriota bacterium]